MQYRTAFHESVREYLSNARIEYQLVHGLPVSKTLLTRDTSTLPWAFAVNNRSFGIHKIGLRWLPLRHACGADLIIFGQENKHLHNYLLQVLPRRLRPQIALFGHGKNFQARDANAPGERWKRFWATRCDWWFAYTEETKCHVVSLGFPAERVTVFNNAIDTATLRQEIGNVTPERLNERRRELRLTAGPVGLFVGALYPEKRLEFLVAASERVRAAVPNFELLIVGAGPAEAELRSRVSGMDWIKLTGPLFGPAKAEVMALADLFLMPGLVGLAVLDAGVAGLPVITTAFPYHSPEIAYLEHGKNGVIVERWQSVEAYANEVIRLLRDEAGRSVMSESARRMVREYTVEAMAGRFASGVLAALNGASA